MTIMTNLYELEPGKNELELAPDHQLLVITTQLFPISVLSPNQLQERLVLHTKENEAYFKSRTVTIYVGEAGRALIDAREKHYWHYIATAQLAGGRVVHAWVERPAHTSEER